ncbi:sensor domain-containing diguanylate cyclase [Rhodoferax sp.]|uniref:GGDEF domain-containing protein n=1 Tax=Rhodoferax sp. TaxID=50421 RepID=UPI0026135CB1|nr:sensor domain-containing diguanylate cyclase [Rhodoferax sp.]MDD5479121.1 sensor domain-containing diguanylate cyclase [Rhodoferax sp.]
MPVLTQPAFFKTPSRLPKSVTWGLLVTAIVFLTGLLAYGLNTIYNDRMARSKHQAERELMAIGHLQAEGVTSWREQRMADALALLDDTLLAQAASTWFKSATPAHALPVQQRLRILQERAKYVAVFLVDDQGQLRLNADGVITQRLPAPEQQALQSAFTQATAVAVEPRVDAMFAFPFFGVIAPLFDGAQATGAVWLVSDVRSTLYPMLDRWPTPSSTAESSIVARQGDALIYLSPLRQAANQNLNVRSLLTRTSDPAVQAVLGTRGIFYAQDYRAQEVIALASAVPDSPWLVVSKIDVAEVMANTQQRELLALGLPVTLGLLLLGILLTLWQRKAWLRERALKADLQRNMRWLENAQKAASIGYFSQDVATQRFTTFHMADAIFNTTQPGLMSVTDWQALIHPDDRERTIALHTQAIKNRQPLRTQYRILHDPVHDHYSDHSLRWVETWCEVELNKASGHVTHLLGTVQDITERKQTEEELNRYRADLEQKIRLDPMTKIANRRALDEQLSAEWQRAMRQSSSLAFLMIDVDFFKLYNDHYGHTAGDECLIKVAQAIAASVNRTGELAARYGGEEFAVVLPDADLARAQDTAERICQAVRSLNMAHAKSTAATIVTVSIGVVSVQPVFTPTSPRTLDASSGDTTTSAMPTGVQRMVNQADEALYRAKQTGRNRAVAYRSGQ